MTSSCRPQRLGKYNLILNAFATTANLYLHTPELEIMWLRPVAEESKVLIRWRVSGKSRVSKHDTQWYDAVSTLHINYDGQVEVSATHVPFLVGSVSEARSLSVLCQCSCFISILHIAPPQPPARSMPAAFLRTTPHLPLPLLINNGRLVNAHNRTALAGARGRQV